MKMEINKTIINGSIVENGNKYIVIENESDKALLCFSYERLVTRFDREVNKCIKVGDIALSPTNIKHRDKFIANYCNEKTFYI